MVLVTIPSCRSSALRILWVAAMRSPEQPAPGRSELRTCDCRARGRIQRYPEEYDNGPAADVLGTSHPRTREGAIHLVTYRRASEFGHVCDSQR
jgi:hypothetical protein